MATEYDLNTLTLRLVCTVVLSVTQCLLTVLAFLFALHQIRCWAFRRDRLALQIQFIQEDKINIKVIGHRFEINDPSIYVLGEIIE